MVWLMGFLSQRTQSTIRPTKRAALRFYGACLADSPPDHKTLASGPKSQLTGTPMQEAGPLRVMGRATLQA